jgi:glycosyltransferase involved in cell wall biosynthesis
VRRITVGIETTFFAGPMTGIANYSYQLLNALLGSYPEVEFRALDHHGWFAFDKNVLQAIVANRYDGTPRAQSLLSRLLRAGFRQSLGRSAVARRVQRGGRELKVGLSVNRQGLDLFHALNFLPPFRSTITTLPVIYDLSFVRFPEVHPIERLRWLERLPRVISDAPFIQTISEFSRREIESIYNVPAHRIVVAPPAASEIFKPLGREATIRGLEEFNLMPQTYFLTVGTLEPRKNLATLVAAYSRLSKRERERNSLMIVGHSGWGNLDLPKQISSLVQEGSVRFLGAVTNQQLRHLYEGAICLCFPSLYEGFGMPAVEAMSCGTRVVHSSGTSIDEITGQTGKRLPFNDVDSWTNALRESIDQVSNLDELRSNLLQIARGFDWNLSAARIRRIYDELLN